MQPISPRCRAQPFRTWSWRALSAAVLYAAIAPDAFAQGIQLPPHFQAVALPGTYNLPVGLVFAADGRALLIEKTGGVRVISAVGNPQASPFLDLSDEVNNDHDRGMLGIALHPGFVPDGGATSWVYLLYTVTPVLGQDYGFNQQSRYSFSRLVRYHALTNGTDVVADVASREILLGHQLADGTVPDGIASLHNSHSNGSLRFADDGSLIIATGDGAHYDYRDTGGHDAAGFDNFVHPTTGLRGPTPLVQDEGALRSQDLRSLAGKILRLDPETGFGYPSNPFFDGDPASIASRVWALGLRNPFRMDLVPGTGAGDPALGQPNVITIGDVGWNKWEEINVSRQGGENFGWPCFEGPLPHTGYQGYVPPDASLLSCATATAGTLTLPVIAWHHTSPTSFYPSGVYIDENGNPLPGFRGVCAIGGAVYAGGAYPPEYDGRLFFGEYGLGKIKTVELDANYGVVAVRDFASQNGGVVDIERHPLTGDLYFLQLSTGRVLQIHWGANLAPEAHATATPSEGAAPLRVDFDASLSVDPDDDVITYDWDFGDGTNHSHKVSPFHKYRVEGNYTAHLTVTDALGLTAATEIEISVGNLTPTAVITTPAPGAIYTTPTVLHLSGVGTDPEDGPLDYRWDVTLFHATHEHPGTFQASGAELDFNIGTSAEDPDLLYYKFELTVTDEVGLSSHAHVFVYPRPNHRDVSGRALPIARVAELAPPHPTGPGNHDIEVIRDTRFVPEGSASPSKQFDTSHGGDQGSDDWIGYELTEAPSAEMRFVGLSFQEGMRVAGGGWFEDLVVEVRDQGTWTAALNVRIAPNYPFDFLYSLFFTGFNYRTYRLDFDPIFGDAIRMRGTPGGNVGFLSCAELRAHLISALAPSNHVDVTSRGRVVVEEFAFLPPQEHYDAFGRTLPLHDGTFPPAGSQSALAQFVTLQSATPWFGYAFGFPRTFTRVEYQEGLDTPAGGAFAALSVEVQSAPGGAWQPVSGLTISPAFPGPNGVSYETFTLDFAPVVARAIRVRGASVGTGQYASAGELRVFGPTPP